VVHVHPFASPFELKLILCPSYTPLAEHMFLSLSQVYGASLHVKWGTFENNCDSFGMLVHCENCFSSCLGCIYALDCELTVCDIMPQDFIILYILPKKGEKRLRKKREKEKTRKQEKKSKNREFLFLNKWHIQLIPFNLWDSFNWG